MRKAILLSMLVSTGALAEGPLEARAVVAPSRTGHRSYLTVSINLAASVTRRTEIAFAPPSSGRMRLAADAQHPVLCVVDQGDGRSFQIPLERCPQDLQGLRRRVWTLEPRAQLFLLLPVVADRGSLPRPRTLFDAGALVSLVEYPRPLGISAAGPVTHVELAADVREEVLATIRLVRE